MTIFQEMFVLDICIVVYVYTNCQFRFTGATADHVKANPSFRSKITFGTFSKHLFQKLIFYSIVDISRLLSLVLRS